LRSAIAPFPKGVATEAGKQPPRPQKARFRVCFHLPFGKPPLQTAFGGLTPLHGRGNASQSALRAIDTRPYERPKQPTALTFASREVFCVQARSKVATLSSAKRAFLRRSIVERE
jgi:hypothetical protein